MAGEAFDSLLLRMGVDLSAVKQAGQQIKQILDAVNQQAQQAQNAAKQAVGAQGAAFNQVKAAAEAAVAASRAAVAQEAVKTAEIKTQTEALKQQSQQYKTALDGSKAAQAEEIAKRAVLQSQTEQINQQITAQKLLKAQAEAVTAEYRKQRAAQAAGGGGGAAGGGGEGGGRTGFGNMLGQFGSAVFGRGLLGSVATGVIAGQGIDEVIKGAVEGVAHFIDKLKEMQDQASQMTLIQNQFEGLAKAAGVDATQAIQKMRVATEGLVDKMTLMKTANAALKSPFGLNLDQVEQLEGAVVKLAEANGKTAVQAIEALNRAMTSGRAQQLMYVTGLSRVAGQLENVAAGVGRVERGSLQFQKTFQLITTQAAALGEMPQTLEQMMTRLSVAWHDLLLEFGRGFNLSAGLQIAIDQMKKFTDTIVGGASTAENWGKAVGNAFLVLTTGAEAAKTPLTVIWDILKGLYNISLGPIFGSFAEISTGADDATKKFKEMNPVLFEILSTTILIDETFKQMVHDVEAVVKPFKELYETYKNIIQVEGAAASVAAKPGGAIGSVAQIAVDTIESKTSNWDKVKARMQAGPAGANRQQSYAPMQSGQGPVAPSEQELNDRDAALGPQRRAQMRMEAIASEAAAKERQAKEAKSIAKPEISDQETLGQQLKELESAKKLEDAKTKLQFDAAKLRLAQNLTDIQTRKEQDDSAYQAAEEDLKTHLKNQQNLEQESYEARKAEAAAQTTEQMALIASRRDLENKKYTDQLKQTGGGTDTVVGRENARIHNELLQEMEIEEQRIKIEGDAKLEALAKQHNATVYNLDRQAQRDEIATKKEQVRALLALQEETIRSTAASQEEQIRAEQGQTQKGLQQGNISPDEYFQKRIALTQQLADVQIKAANDTAEAQKEAARADYQTGPLTVDRLTQMFDKMRKAGQKAADDIRLDVQKAQDALTDLAINEVQVRLQAIQKQFQPQVQAGQGAIGALQGQPGTQQQVEQLTESMIGKLGSQKVALESLLSTIKPFSEEWYQVYENIEKADDAQMKFKESLQQMQDMMRPLSQAFSSIGAGITESFHSKFAQSLGASVSAGAKSMAESTKLGQQIAGKGVAEDPVVTKLRETASGLFASVKSASDPLVSGFQKLSTAIQLVIDHLQELAGIERPGAASARDEINALPLGANAPSASVLINPAVLAKLGVNTTGGTGQSGGGTGVGGTGAGTSAATGIQQWTDKLTASISVITNFTSAILNAHSAIAGAAGGATAGAGVGNAASSAVTAMGGDLGPWGQIGGAAIGGVIGLVTGHKNAEVTDNIHGFEQDFKDIMNQFALNTNNLQQTIAATASLVAQIQQMQSSSKKGSAQYQSLIDQYNQQIIQLEQQQHQIIVQMGEMLAIANTPLTGQSFLSELQGYFNTFEQQAGAAQTVQQLADAYSLLNQNVQNYVTTSGQQLLQDQQQAIQDALNLNDLLFTQQQDILQFNEQIQSVLSQGVLVRTPTRAMTAGAQMQSMSITFQRQQQQLQEQIAATQYRVAAESQIFNLAQTRIGLENQLLQAQNAQTNLDMARIAALQNFVNAINSGNWQLVPGLLNLIASLPSVTNPVGSAAITPPTGGQNGTQVTGQQTLDSILAAAYQDNASMGLSGFSSGANVAY